MNSSTSKIIEKNNKKNCVARNVAVGSAPLN